VNYQISHISRDEVMNGFDQGFYCCMSGVCKRKFRSDMWIDIHDQVGSIGLLARHEGRIIAQTIWLPKKYARRIGLPTGTGHVEDMDSTMSISCLQVHELHRNNGVATKMIQATIDFCRLHEYKRIDACVDHRAPPEAFQWLPSFTPFKKFGFEVEGSRVAWEDWPESRICSLAL
jgi:GNAT superfamily N-acetyltransferase